MHRVFQNPDRQAGTHPTFCPLLHAITTLFCEEEKKERKGKRKGKERKVTRLGRISLEIAIAP